MILAEYSRNDTMLSACNTYKQSIYMLGSYYIIMHDTFGHAHYMRQTIRLLWRVSI